MRESALFINGIFESVLKEIWRIQSVLPEQILFLQPYKGQPIVELRHLPPSVDDPMRLFLSITTDLNNVHYGAEIVGWDDKNILAGEKRRVIEEILAAFQKGEEGGLYDLAKDRERPSQNLIHIRRLKKLDPPFPVSHLVKTREGTPLQNRNTPGGWAYVHKDPVPAEPEEPREPEEP
jgi:5-methylcytosine-specific restriction enzyme A